MTILYRQSSALHTQVKHQQNVFMQKLETSQMIDGYTP